MSSNAVLPVTGSSRLKADYTVGYGFRPTRIRGVSCGLCVGCTSMMVPLPLRSSERSGCDALPGFRVLGRGFTEATLKQEFVMQVSSKSGRNSGRNSDVIGPTADGFMGTVRPLRCILLSQRELCVSSSCPRMALSAEWAGKAWGFTQNTKLART